LYQNIGLWARSGIYSSATAARIDSSYGVYVDAFSRAGTIGEMYGVYIAPNATLGSVQAKFDFYAGNPDAKNYFAGNVGIGITTPTNKLEVNGVIRAKEVRVEAAPWPDHVFADDYQLPTLNAVAAYIAEHRHLPGVPAAAEIEEKGMGLSAMATVQMQKIEELTLYVLKLEADKVALQQQLSAQGRRLDAIEARISK